MYISLKESLIGNVKNPSKALKELTSVDFLKKLVYNSIEFVDGHKPDDIIIDKNLTFVRLCYKKFPMGGGSLKMILDAGLWDQYKLPKQFHISKFKSKTQMPSKQMIRLGIKNSKGKNIEGFTFNFGEIFFRNGILFIDSPNNSIKLQNCIFETPVLINCIENLYINGRVLGYNSTYNYVEKNDDGTEEGYYIDFKMSDPTKIIGKNQYLKDHNLVQIMLNYSKVRQYDTYSRVNEILRKKYDFGDPNIMATFST